MRKRIVALVLFFQFFILWRGWYWTWKGKDSKESFAKDSILYLMKRWGKSFHLDEKINRFSDAVNSVLSAIHFSSWIAELWQAGPTRPANLWEWCRTGAMQVKEELLAGSQCKLVQLEAGMLLKLPVSGRSSPLQHLCSAVPLKSPLQSVSTISLLLKLQIKPRPQIWWCGGSL